MMGPEISPLNILCDSHSACSNRASITSPVLMRTPRRSVRLSKFRCSKKKENRQPVKICLVRAFPPSKVVLNEYGYHVARELQADPLIALTVLADELKPAEPELPEFDVE